MPKIPVNIKLDGLQHDWVEDKRGDINRTRFFERILERLMQEDELALTLLDQAFDRDNGPRAAVLRLVKPEPEPEPLPQEDTPEPPAKPAAKPRAKKKAAKQAEPLPEPEVTPPEPVRKRPPRVAPVLTGRLRR